MTIDKWLSPYAWQAEALLPRGKVYSIHRPVGSVTHLQEAIAKMKTVEY